MPYSTPVKTMLDQRTVITKFRDIVNANPDAFKVEHTRQRATKNNPEDNVYALQSADGTILAALHTNKSKAVWRADLADRVRAARGVK